MQKYLLTLPLLLFLLLAAVPQSAAGQTAGFEKDLNRLMEIPGLHSLAASTSHLYALSENDGLVVFRVHADSLQWLYSSEGMQRRGNKLSADIRFAYLTGSDNRLTVVEPTSVLGVYSSTTLPARPGPLTRIGEYLYLGMDKNGLFRLPLKTPESVDSEPQPVQKDRIGEAKVVSIQALGRQLFVLTSDSRLHRFEVRDDEMSHQQTFQFDQPLDRVFIVDDKVMVSNRHGDIFELSGGGELRSRFSVGSTVSEIHFWKDNYFIRTRDGEVWTARGTARAEVFRSDKRARNLITTTKNQLWMSEYNQLFPLRRAAITGDGPALETGQVSETLKIKSIDSFISPFPRPVLLPIRLEGNFPPDRVRFQVRGSSETATIRDHGFFWQPGSRDVGMNQFTIIATSTDGQTDSTSFNIEVRAFNTPPRFTTVRPLSIPVGEKFELPVRATDPDGTDPDLIRYLGVNLPEGASISESTGRFTWTPTRRQTGTHEFQVYATDQFGSTANISITINVMELTRGN